jgi:acetylornithine/succinyldiaminopimelate/putrescine aminotransferase
MIDEVQTGLGRTGRWFGYQYSDVQPDVVTMAKALGNGVPIGACWARAGIAEALRPGDHATTFGGQPLAARAALAVLDVMEAEDVPARATRAGEQLTTALLALPQVVDVRGRGLLVAAELAPGIDAASVGRACLERGLVLNAVTPTALRLAPSLLVGDDEIAEAVAILGAVLGETGEGGT